MCNRRRAAKQFIFAISGLWLAFAAAVLAPAPASAQVAEPDNSLPPLCRFGVNHIRPDIENFDLAALRVGYYIDYQAVTSPPAPNNMQYFRMIRLSQTGVDTYNASPSLVEIDAIAEADPGAVWLVGNEPDQVTQDSMEPLAYAVAYHDIYQALKQADPTAQVFAGNIVQSTPLRLKYLDLVLQAYQSRYNTFMPVDGWGIHAFILNEEKGKWGADIPPGLDETTGMVLQISQNADFDLFRQQIVSFRTWMAARGYRNVPLYVTEYGVLMPTDYGFPPAVVNTFMNQTFQYMLATTDPATGYPDDDYRLIQRFAWYSVNDKIYYDQQSGSYVGFNGYLFDPQLNNARSEMGDNYAQFTQSLPTLVDFVAAGLLVTPSLPLRSAGPVTLTLGVQVSNAGNTYAQQPFRVQVYNGNPDQGGQMLADAEFTGQIAGCGASQTYSYAWPQVTPGVYDLYAVVTPNPGVTDINPTNNRLLRRILFVDQVAHLPLVFE